MWFSSDYYDKYGSEWGAVLIGSHTRGAEHSGIAYRDTIMSPNWLPITQDEYPGSRYDHETIWSRVITFTYLQVGGSLLTVVSWLKNIVGYHVF